MDRKNLVISLTGPQSHQVKIPLGQGSFSIGLQGMNAKKFDVLVNNNLPLNWKAFDEFSTPAGSHWPRFLYYWGNDTGFIEWSHQRAIEDFWWSPSQTTAIDLTGAQINRLEVHLETSQLKVVLNDSIRFLNLLGNLHHFEFTPHENIPHLGFYPTLTGIDSPPYQLPAFKSFQLAKSVEVSVKPTGQPFDCASLLQFTQLKHLSLSGHLSNVESLAKLKDLSSLAIRISPNLANFPSLDTWQNLRCFIGWNIEETQGKRLRTELRKLAKERELEYSSVSKLRKPIWFTTEYAIPFSAWEEKTEKKAIKAYKLAVKKALKAKNEAEVATIITEFVAAINLLPNIETSEREDAWVAVEHFIAAAPIDIDQEKAMNWFDQARDF